MRQRLEVLHQEELDEVRAKLQAEYDQLVEMRSSMMHSQPPAEESGSGQGVPFEIEKLRSERDDFETQLLELKSQQRLLEDIDELREERDALLNELGDLRKKSAVSRSSSEETDTDTSSIPQIQVTEPPTRTEEIEKLVHEKQVLESELQQYKSRQSLESDIEILREQREELESVIKTLKSLQKLPEDVKELEDAKLDLEEHIENLKVKRSLSDDLDTLIDEKVALEAEVETLRETRDLPEYLSELRREKVELTEILAPLKEDSETLLKLRKENQNMKEKLVFMEAHQKQFNRYNFYLALLGDQILARAFEKFFLFFFNPF